MVQSNTVTITVTAPAPVLTSIVLSAGYANIETGQTDILAATAYDQYNNPMTNVPLTITESTTGNTWSGNTNTSGQFSTPILTFNNAGSFSFVASG